MIKRPPAAAAPQSGGGSRGLTPRDKLRASRVSVGSRHLHLCPCRETRGGRGFTFQPEPVFASSPSCGTGLMLSARRVGGRGERAAVWRGGGKGDPAAPPQTYGGLGGDFLCACVILRLLGRLQLKGEKKKKNEE